MPFIDQPYHKNNSSSSSSWHYDSTQNSANHNLTLPQIKTTNHRLHSIRYMIATHWNSVQNSLDLNFANNFVSFEKHFVSFERNIHLDNPTIVWSFQRYIFIYIYIYIYIYIILYYIMPFKISQPRIMKFWNIIWNIIWKLFTAAAFR